MHNKLLTVYDTGSHLEIDISSLALEGSLQGREQWIFPRVAEDLSLGDKKW